MKILYDENIPYGREAFAHLGDVRACAGRAITPAAVHDVDVLLVRSVTPVNEALLHDSRVRFVATATSGSDHLDHAYLQQRGIQYVDAIGSNAESVAEYVVAGLLDVAARHNLTLAGKRIGVIGVGHVGTLVARYAAALGLTVLLNDPPRQRTEPDFLGVSLDEALAADIVTLHTPLTKEGVDATYHLLDARRIAALAPDTILVHTCRGPVVDTAALCARLRAHNDLRVIMDVWEGEPVVANDLLQRVALGTPHIAGYSWPSKVRATDIIYRAACAFIGVAPQWHAPSLPPATPAPQFRVDAAAPTPQAAVRGIVRALYAIVADDARLRRQLALPPDQHGAHFDLLRKKYPVRLEWPQVTLLSMPAAFRTVFAALGFADAKEYT
jgi:erythronate-4-phosphate dehydrogenase